jgi:hypothetical protein
LVAGRFKYVPRHVPRHVKFSFGSLEQDLVQGSGTICIDAMDIGDKTPKFGIGLHI